MRKLRKFKLYESNSSLSDSDQERLELIEKNKETFVSQFEELAGKGNMDRFLDHYNVLMYIQEEPDLMASILLPLLKNEKFNEWVSSINDELPDSFKDSLGVASDLKRLGF